MKHLLTAIACCLAVAGSAQTPYNPDSNGDSFVGSADLVSLLSLYGELAPVDSLTVVTADALELLGYETTLSGYEGIYGDSLPIYEVTADVDVVVAHADTCMMYVLSADAGDLQKFYYESFYIGGVTASCSVIYDSLFYAGCNPNLWPFFDTHIRGAIFLNGRWFCMD